MTANLTAFRDDFMQDEDVLCFQEVDFENGEWDVIKGIFSNYPHTYQTINETTAFVFPWQSTKKTSIAILSKHSFTSTNSSLIQTDPAVDKWERHAQHVTINLDGETVNIFNFHNTYNFNDNDFEYEKSGLEKFKSYVLSRLNITTLNEGKKLIMLGDFNVFQANVDSILPATTRISNGRDHIVSVLSKEHSGIYTTASAKLSDHNAVWTAIDLESPNPNEMQWFSVPVEDGTTSISMVAATASDPNGLEYYFTNTTIADGSHDSGWQNSPVYIDTGLNMATSYSYTVKARDKSANANETEVSELLSAYTGDGDALPNDWEIFYFGNLQASSGDLTEDWDKDGFSDISEYLAGTDPDNAFSLLKAWLDESVTSSTIIRWNSVAGKKYQVYSSSKPNSDWELLADDVSAITPISGYTDTRSGNSKQFYRVEVKP